MQSKLLFSFMLGFIVWMGSPVIAHLQSTPQKLDLELTRDFKKMIGAAIEDNYHLFDSLMRPFKTRIKKDLATTSAFTNPFDSLSQEMWIVRSEDKLLRIFSWDELSGGTWHDMAGFAQFKTSSGKIRVKQLDTDREMELSQYTDVIITKIYLVTLKNKTYYLTIGYGTHGAGHHHKTAQMFSIDGENLVKCTDCFESGEDLVVVSARSYDPGLVYDPVSKQISYNEFVEDKGNFMVPTGKVISLKIQNNQFHQ